ncbi:DUF4349 domain-containing protein [Ornithobacterium rhinotracheale]|uniref:DUF4349 domain-containing protein n=1 Tax=Ornithobacterium rhinotracheale TaxID=28251 RepID=A0A3R5YUV6_ORNRH|nr:DUF4349 domain-containing protein [Ornithobacterium rhinotracheale]
MKNLLFLSIILFTLFSCQKNGEFVNKEPIAENMDFSSPTDTETNPSEEQKATEKILIKNGNIIIDSPSPEKNLQELKDILKSMGAEISDETQTSQKNYMEVDLVCRIASQNFDKLIEKIEKKF